MRFCFRNSFFRSALGFLFRKEYFNGFYHQSVVFIRYFRRPNITMPYYAVRKGHEPGVYETWAECQKQTVKFKGAQFKKFENLEDAEQFMIDGKSKDRPAPYNIADKGSRRSDKTDKQKTVKSKKGDDNNANSSDVDKDDPDDTEPVVVVYTDGCCFNNGKHGSVAGVGVYWGPEDPNNLSEKLDGRQTNNRAEIEASCRALEQAKSRGIKKLEIRTDSGLLVNAASTWMKGWKKNGWTKSNKEPVQNVDDFKRLDVCMEGMKVVWTYVEGHNGVKGNEEADKLAKAGARQTK